HAIPAGRGRGRFFPRHHYLSESLVCGGGPRKGCGAVHGGHPGVAGHCRTGFGGADAGSLVRPSWLAVVADSGRDYGAGVWNHQLVFPDGQTPSCRMAEGGRTRVAGEGTRTGTGKQDARGTITVPRCAAAARSDPAVPHVFW